MDDRVLRRCVVLGLALIALLGPSLSLGQGGSDAVQPLQATADPVKREIALPTSLANLRADPTDDQEVLKRRPLTWAQVGQAIKPQPLPEAQPSPPAELPKPQVLDLVSRADAAIERGEVFAGIELLRQAQQQEPGNLLIARQLGIAYMHSGNRVRGADILNRVLATNLNDAGVLVLLAQHAAQQGDLQKTLDLSHQLRRVDASVGAACLSDLYCSLALEQAGYTQAAADRLGLLITGISKLDPAARNAQANANSKQDPVLLHELAVLIKLSSELRVRLGDLHLSLGQEQAAADAYAGIDPALLADHAGMVFRLAYLALRRGDVEQAMTQAVTHLSSSAATVDDAELVTYLVSQGVPAEQLAQKLVSAMDQQGQSLAMLAGLTRVAPPGQAIDAIGRWLATRTAEPAILRQAAGLIALDDDRPEDAQPLAALLALTADLMRQQPEQARSLAQAVVGDIDAYICLLRALKDPQIQIGDDAFRALLVAIAFEHAGKSSQAIQAYQRAVELDNTMLDHTRLPLARQLINAAKPREALAILENAGQDANWEHFELTARAMLGNGDTEPAMRLIDAWLAEHGDTTRALLLRAELIAQAGELDQALELLFALARQYPMDERPYKLALELIVMRLNEIRSVGNALAMRRNLLAMIQKNLPDSVTARIEQAFEIYQKPENAQEAQRLLLAVVQQEPKNRLAWLMLEEVYQLAGDEDKAAWVNDQLMHVAPPDVSLALDRASRAMTLGQLPRAAALLKRTLELDAQDLLPGPDIDGNAAASMLQMLGSAEPDLDTEALALVMVRRFPDNVLLNNALGYQWAVQDKNLLQAKAMIQRALDGGGENHSVLDSMGWVHYKLGDFAQAEAFQRRAIEALRTEQLRQNEQLRASKAVLYDHMGDIMLRLGETASAIRHWQIARAQRLEDQDMMFEPELRTLGQRVDAKINAVREGLEPPVATVPDKQSHGPEGHPADLQPEGADQPEQPAPAGEAKP